MANRLDVSPTMGSGRLRYLLIISAVALVLFGDPANSRSYAAAPFAGRVVDAETGQPIPGVIVLAQWIVEGPAEAHPVGAMQIMETVTDENGRYSFPGWGPKAVPRPDFWSWVFTPVLTTKDPQLFFMKSGYGHFYVQNDIARGKEFDFETELRKSQVDGKDIHMTNLKGNAAARRRDYDVLFRRPYGIRQLGCTWIQMPRTIEYLYKERSNLTALGERPDISQLVEVAGCPRQPWMAPLER